MLRTSRDYLKVAWSLALAGTVGISLVYLVLPIALPDSVPSAHAQNVGVPGAAEEKSSPYDGTIGPQDEPSGDGQDATTITGVNTAGAVRVNNLANLEAVLNILANSLEIWGLFVNAPSLFLGAIVAFVRVRLFLGAFLLLSVPASIIGGLASPGLINWVVASSRDAGMEENIGVMAVAVALAWAALLCIYGFIPAIWAFASKHSQKWLILGTTFFSWIVPILGWPALLFWALYDPKKEREKTPYLPPELRS